MATQVTDQEIRTFVRKVQRQLTDLGPDDLRELTENLEADILDRRDAEGTKFNLGDSKAYAHDLMEAAGLGLESVEVSRLNLAFLKFWKSTIAYFRTLSPAWAIVRGWLMFVLIYMPLAYGRIGEIPNNARDALILVALIAVNVWLGRKKFSALRYPLVVLNVLLLVASPLVAADLRSVIDDYSHYKILNDSGFLMHKGQPVFSLCAFDGYGSPLVGVGLIKDQNGETIFINGDAEKLICN